MSDLCFGGSIPLRRAKPEVDFPLRGDIQINSYPI